MHLLYQRAVAYLNVDSSYTRYDHMTVLLHTRQSEISAVPSLSSQVKFHFILTREKSKNACSPLPDNLLCPAVLIEFMKNRVDTS